MAKQGALSARLPVPSDSEDSHHSFNSEPAMPVSRHQSAKSRMGEATPLMLDVPGHFRDLPMFMDTAVRMKSGRWKAMMEAVVSKARSLHSLFPALIIHELLPARVIFHSVKRSRHS